MSRVMEFYPWEKTMSKNLSTNYIQKLLGTTQKSAADALKTASK